MSFPPPTERQARIIWMALTGMALAAVVGLVVALVWGLGWVLHVMAPVLWPLAVAGVLACLLDPAVDFLVRKKVPRTRAIVVVFAMALVIVLGLLGSVVPQLVIETQQFASKVPVYKERVRTKAEQLISNPPAIVRKYFMRERAKPAEEPTTPALSAQTNAVVQTNVVANVVPVETSGTTNVEPAVLPTEPSL